MSTYKAEHLKALIRETVREEIRETVAGVIAEVISERYLRKLAEGIAAARPRGVADLDIQGDDEPDDDYTPRPLANHIRGVGQDDPVFQKEPKRDHVRQFGEGTERNTMLNRFFEGTRPLDAVEREAGMFQPGADGIEPPPHYEDEESEQEQDDIPLEESVARPARGAPRREMKDIWRELAGVKDASAPPAIDPAVRQKLEEDRLKRQREMLETRVISG